MLVKDADIVSSGRTIPLVYSAALLCLALYKSAEFWKHNGRHSSDLVLILLKDQAFYFVM